MAGLSDLASLVEASGMELIAEEVNNRRERKPIQINEDEIRELTKKWENTPRERTSPNYVGKSEEQWLADNARIRDLLVTKRKKGYHDNYLSGILRNNGFLNEYENENILKNLERPRLHTENIWVPGAVADEFLSQKLLQYGGFSPVKLENAKGDPMATDLNITVDGAPRLMDAQSRVSSSDLNLEVLLYDDRARRFVLDNPNMPLNEALKRVADMNTGVKEGKMLHTADSSINPILSNKMVGKPRHHKDFLISSNRNRMHPGHRTPYNKEFPLDWDVVDLERAREILLPLSPNQMGEKYGIETTAGYYNDALILRIPDEAIKREFNNRFFTEKENPELAYAKWRMTQRRNRR